MQRGRRLPVDICWMTREPEFGLFGLKSGCMKLIAINA